MTSRSNSYRFAKLAGTALAATLLAGCASQAMTVKANSADAARAALAKGQGPKAVAAAEAAVAANPRDAALRVLLAQSYFKSGRFASAATTFDDAMKLGDNSARTALSLALAKIGAGDQRGALAVLDDWRSEIPAADLGLALALAGEPERGVIVLADAIRGGDNTPKTRQNLAYSYALSGRWKESRLMAAQDVPAEKLGDRMTEWASTIQPEQYQQRVAALLGAPVRADPGQPAMLALSESPADQQLAAQTAVESAPAVAIAPAKGGELPALGSAPAAPVVAAPVVAEAQPAAPAAVEAAPQAAYVSEPMVQQVPVAAPARPALPAYVSSPLRPKVAKAQVRATVRPAAFRPAAQVRPTAAPGTHLVQLGSFSSEQGARRAWGIYTARNAALTGYRMTITPANVRGKNVWRVAAAGLTGAPAATGLCAQVKSKGGACFAYAAPKAVPAPGQNQRNAGGPEFARRR